MESVSKRARDIQPAVDEISRRYYKITSLKEASIWKSDALALQNILASIKIELYQCLDNEELLLQDAENNKKYPPISKRIAGLAAVVEKHKANLAVLDKDIAGVDMSTAFLYMLISRVPTTASEAMSLLVDLSILKKELTVEKREVNEEIRQKRTKARQDLAKWSRGHANYSGKSASSTRLGAINPKGMSLSPLETRKGNIEYELIEVYKAINWLKRLEINDAAPIQDKILRCSLCGRRVNPGETCSGCGSNQATYGLG